MSCESVLTEAPTTRSKPTPVWLKLIAWIDPERRVLLALLGLTFVLGVTYAVITPLFAGPDEDVHYEYVQSLWDSGGTKVTGRASYHYPAYYWLDSPAYALTRSQPKEVQVVAMRLVSLVLLLGQVVLAYLSAKLLSPKKPFVYLSATAIVALLPGRVWIGSMINDDNLASFASALVMYLFLRCLFHPPNRKCVVALSASMVLALATKTTAWSIVAVVAVALASIGAVRLWRNKPIGRSVVITSLVVVTALVFVLLTAIVVDVVGEPGREQATQPNRYLEPQTAVSVPAPSWAAVSPIRRAGESVYRLVRQAPVLGRYIRQDWSKLKHVPAWQPGPFVHQFKTFWIPLWSDDYSAPDSEYQKALLLSVVALVGLAISLIVGSWKAWRGSFDGRYSLAITVLTAAILAAWAVSTLQHLLGVAGTGSFDGPRSAWPGTHARYLFPALIPMAYLMAVGIGRFIPYRMRLLGLMALVTAFIYLNGVTLWSIMSHAYWWAS